MAVLRRSFALLAFFAAAALPGPLPAQAHSTARDSAIARLQTGQQIRLTTADLGRLVGRAGVPTADSLDLAQDDAVRRIPIPAIDTLWTRGGSGVTGAIVGGVIGGVLGSLAVVAAARRVRIRLRQHGGAGGGRFRAGGCCRGAARGADRWQVSEVEAGVPLSGSWSLAVGVGGSSSCSTRIAGVVRSSNWPRRAAQA